MLGAFKLHFVGRTGRVASTPPARPSDGVFDVGFQPKIPGI